MCINKLNLESSPNSLFKSHYLFLREPCCLCDGFYRNAQFLQIKGDIYLSLLLTLFKPLLYTLLPSIFRGGINCVFVQHRVNVFFKFLTIQFAGLCQCENVIKAGSILRHRRKVIQISEKIAPSFGICL